MRWILTLVLLVVGCGNSSPNPDPPTGSISSAITATDYSWAGGPHTQMQSKSVGPCVLTGLGGDWSPGPSGEHGQIDIYVDSSGMQYLEGATFASDPSNDRQLRANARCVSWLNFYSMGGHGQPIPSIREDFWTPTGQVFESLQLWDYTAWCTLRGLRWETTGTTDYVGVLSNGPSWFLERESLGGDDGPRGNIAAASCLSFFKEPVIYNFFNTFANGQWFNTGFLPSDVLCGLAKTSLPTNVGSWEIITPWAGGTYWIAYAGTELNGNVRVTCAPYGLP
jgi:hypothetical protein